MSPQRQLSHRVFSYLLRRAKYLHLNGLRPNYLRWIFLLIVGVVSVVTSRSWAAGQEERVFLPTLRSSAWLAPANVPGFGDARNDYAWSMAWFKGNLYIGTSRTLFCVERATLDFFFPGQNYYVSQPDEGFSCPEDPYDMDLRAEIWQYNPMYPINRASSWTRVYQSPNSIPNPRAPGKFVPADIGFRGMMVYTEPDGTEALYALGVTTNEYIPELAADHPPRILRSTDGETFTPLDGAPGILNTAVGSQRPIGFRASAAYDERFFVTAGGGLTGDGVVMEVRNPQGPNPTFTQVSPQGMQVFEMIVFNDYLYVGTGDLLNGYGVWKTDATGTRPYQFTPVITNGAGRGGEITSVVSMYVFQDRLYVGASGWYSTLLPASELIRINPDDSWDVVVGNTRAVDFQIKFPISGLPDGFGNPFNAHFWRMQELDNTLYLGTNDWSYGFRTLPEVDEFLRPQYGFDIYWSCDGQFWFPATYDAFGDGLYNFGVRTMASTSLGGIIGSTNYAQGTHVWNAASIGLCADPTAASAADAQPDATDIPPNRLEAERQGDATLLSWEPAPGAVKYRIQRAEYHTNAEVGIQARTDLPPQPTSVDGRFLPGIDGGGLPDDALIPDAFVEIGQTTELVFVDEDARPGVRYSYQVRAENRAGVRSVPSNLVIVPSLHPTVTFDLVMNTVSELAADGKLAPEAATTLQAQLVAAQDAASTGDYARVLQLLSEGEARVAQNSTTAFDPTVQELTILIERLARRVSLAEQGHLSLEP